MKKFKIIKLHDEPYDFLVIATTFENPLSLISEIEKAIMVKSARILFDLTLINGLKSNRYIECNYLSGSTITTSCNLVHNVSNSIREISRRFFVKNERIVKKSVIPNALKFLVRSDMV